VTLYHGGIAGLGPGDRLVPSPPHVTDGCPVCTARAAGRVCTVGEWRAWVKAQPSSPASDSLLKAMEAVADDEPIDPPSEVEAVFVTTSKDYATWYAARSGNGDLYQVRPLGPLERQPQDHFPSWTTPAAEVVKVIRRGVHLSPLERRRIIRLWERADRKVDRRRARAGA